MFLISRLGDSRWYVIRNVVYVLGRIAHQGVERALDRALHHEDVRVRKEAVRALGNIESPTSRAFLISAFRDLDAGVRVQAALTLAQRRDDRAAQSIWSAISSPEFARPRPVRAPSVLSRRSASADPIRSCRASARC